MDEQDSQTQRSQAVDLQEHTLQNDAEAQAALVVATDPVQEFDIQTICKNFSMVLYGARRKGKSVLVHYILSQIYDRFDEVVLLSDTADLQPEIWHFVPEKNRHVGWKEEVLKEVMDKAQEERKKMEKQFAEDMSNEKKDAERDDKMTKRLVILDDIISHPEVRKSSVFKSYFTTGRHFYISVIILSQNASARESLSISARGNMDYTLTTKMKSLDDTIRLSRYYYGSEGWKKGVARINQLTQEPFSFAVSDMANTENTGLLVETTYVIKAPKLEDQDSNWVIGKEHDKQHGSTLQALDGENAHKVLTDGIARMIELEAATGPPLLMLLPGREWEADLEAKGITVLPHGLQPGEAKKRKFTKYEDEKNDAKEVHGEEDLPEIRKMRKIGPGVPWSDLTLTWEGKVSRF